MKAVGYYAGSQHTLIDIELPKPKATGYDLLVEVKAVAVNPVDVKVKKNTQL